MKKLIRWILISATALLIIIIGASFYMLSYSLTPENRGKHLESSYSYMYEKYPHLKSWVDSLNQVSALKDTFIKADDGTRLHAFYVKAAVPTAKTAVIVHGYTDNAIRMFMIGHLYSHEMGYNILLPDLRNTGQSEGEYIQMGWNDRLDVLRWMDIANHIYGDSTRMVVHGISMGAATTMMVSGEQPQRPYMRCYVEDCGYTSVWDEFSHELKETFHLPAFPLMYTTSWLCKLKYGWSFREASALKQVAKCQMPMFFIHGNADDFVPTWMVHPLYEAKSSPKELWLVPGVKHALSYKEEQTEYVQRVRNFVEKYINGPSPSI